MHIERAIRKTDAEGRVIGKSDILQRMLADLKRQHDEAPDAVDKWRFAKAVENTEYWLTHRPKAPQQKAAETRDAGSLLRPIDQIHPAPAPATKDGSSVMRRSSIR